MPPRTPKQDHKPKRQRKHVGKRRPRYWYDPKKAVAGAIEYKNALLAGTKGVTYEGLAEAYQCPKSSIRGHVDRWKKTGEPIRVLHQGAPYVMHPHDEDNLSEYVRRCSDLGFGRNIE